MSNGRKLIIVTVADDDLGFTCDECGQWFQTGQRAIYEDIGHDLIPYKTEPLCIECAEMLIEAAANG